MLLHQRVASPRRHRQGKGVVMTRDDVIRMAVESGFGKEHGWEKYERFAALVAQQEREACAKVCESTYTNGDGAEGWLEIVAGKIRTRTNSTVKQSLTVAEAVTAEREACLAEIETGIWIDMTTDEILASIADSIRARGAK